MFEELSGADAIAEGMNEPSAEGSRRNPQRKRHGARNQHKMKHFVRWLLETFDLPSKKVVDVAGGKGELAARLCMCHQISVTMIDPRPSDPGRCFETVVVPKLPNKWQQRLQEQCIANPHFVSSVLSDRFKQLVMCLTEETLDTCPELQQALADCDLIVGLHADGATEPIIQAALRYQKPFVVVPCCVFPTFFRERRVVDERGDLVSVRTYEQFCRYLLDLDMRFQQIILPFEGRNIAIYYTQKQLSSIDSL